ncbi:hypothetical protein V1J52_23525 [Streptomyces sp. TRM 70351]|uniref:DUF4190 domain-containing protein n=1 Tax=Streptomyces sp. TRM 70351 TaxID=3116552 RepID=UPI002E7C142B|nr:hypothetical protein [Streptomyces sp. TRM 70351]MEE1931115.1 hypothetical protein [Streptomyces sp. TRM 70351]
MAQDAAEQGPGDGAPPSAWAPPQEAVRLDKPAAVPSSAPPSSAEAPPASSLPGPPTPAVPRPQGPPPGSAPGPASGTSGVPPVPQAPSPPPAPPVPFPGPPYGHPGPQPGYGYGHGPGYGHAGQPPYGYNPGMPWQPPAPPPKTSGICTAAMVIGIIGTSLTLTIWGSFVAILLGPLALGLGITARRRVARGEAHGSAQATTGFVLGIVCTALSALFVAILVIAISAESAEDDPDIYYEDYPYDARVVGTAPLTPPGT